MEHRYNMDFMYNRTSRQQTIGSDSDSVDSIPELHDNLPYFYKKFIIIKNYGKGRYSKSKYINITTETLINNNKKCLILIQKTMLYIASTISTISPVIRSKFRSWIFPWHAL